MTATLNQAAPVTGAELNKVIKYMRTGGDKAREIAEKAFDLARPSFAPIGLWLGSIDDLELSPLIILPVPA